jgi:hypothetical protein
MAAKHKHRPRKTPPRPGPSYPCDGVARVRSRNRCDPNLVKSPNTPRVITPAPRFVTNGTIAELWGNDAPGGDMAIMRAENRDKIRLRAEQSRRDAKNYLQRRIKEKVA